MRARRLATFVVAGAAAIIVLAARPRHIVHLPVEVLGGCPGWFFRADESSLWPGSDANVAANIATVNDVAQFLAAQEVAFVAVPVPDESRVDSGRMRRLRRPEALDGRLGRMIALLQAAGVKTIDFRPRTEPGRANFALCRSRRGETGVSFG